MTRAGNVKPALLKKVELEGAVKKSRIAASFAHNRADDRTAGQRFRNVRECGRNSCIGGHRGGKRYSGGRTTPLVRGSLHRARRYGKATDLAGRFDGRPVGNVNVALESLHDAQVGRDVRGGHYRLRP